MNVSFTFLSGNWQAARFLQLLKIETVDSTNGKSSLDKNRPGVESVSTRSFQLF